MPGRVYSLFTTGLNFTPPAIKQQAHKPSSGFGGFKAKSNGIPRFAKHGKWQMFLRSFKTSEAQCPPPPNFPTKPQVPHMGLYPLRILRSTTPLDRGLSGSYIYGPMAILNAGK